MDPPRTRRICVCACAYAWLSGISCISHPPTRPCILRTSYPRFFSSNRGWWFWRLDGREGGGCCCCSGRVTRRQARRGVCRILPRAL
ncbi:hypothetical protein BDZ94DRAFT_1243793 [Collybia nuda]|uniref:Secreted protein n=1 Tax=Collybia nuda TaxID=64659 RepID=A0A9P5YHK7_9AGAR|nr:hypothetical protein BDZ94DRAFT_1243793 [Collybia nuda]